MSQMKTLRRFYRLWWTCDGVKSYVDGLKIEEDMVADEGTQAAARVYQVGEKLIT